MSRTSRTRLATIIGSLAVSTAALAVLLMLLSAGPLNTAFAREPISPSEMTEPLAPAAPAANQFDVIINEWSQGHGGSKEWVELLVVNGPIDMRGWDLGDSSPGDLTFSNDALWSNVPAGSLIVIYNGADKDTSLPADDTDLSDYTVVIPHNNATYFGGNWPALSNTTNSDNPHLRDDSDTTIHDYSTDPGSTAALHPGSNQCTYYQGNTAAGVSAASNWASDQPADDVTPGEGNGGDNTTWVNELRVGDQFDITKTAPNMISPGQLFAYTIVVTNSTGITTTGTVITDVIPTNADFASASDGGVLVGDTVSWVISGNFTDGLAITRTFQVTATSSSGVNIVNEDYGVRATNWVTMAAGNPITTVVSPLDLIVTKTGPDYAVIGENVVYTITLNNVGVTTATNTILTDTLPVSTTYVADSSGIVPTIPSAGVYVWVFADVLSNTLHTFNLTATVDSGVTSGTVLTNTVEASTDTAGDNPANNSAQWETTACPLVFIHDIQYVDESVGGTFASSYADQTVAVEGVVVAETAEIDLYDAYVIEDPAGGPWSGLMVLTAGNRDPVNEGNYVRLIGLVDEHYGMTYLNIKDSVGGRQWVLSSTNPLPAPEVITTGAFVRLGNTYSAEAYESVFIEFQNATVTDEDVGFGMWEFDDGSGAATGDDEGREDGDYTYSPTLGDIYNYIRGIGWYSYSEYKVEPRYDADIGLRAFTPAIAKDAPSLVAPGALFTYTITVENQLGYPLNGVVITDVVPVNATFAYALDGGVESSGVVSWTVASLPSESSVTARFAVTATISITTITNADYAVVASNFVTPTAGAPVGTVVGAEVAIHHIQGAAHLSPLLGQDVQDVHGIVTAKRYNGFYMQDPNPDSDIATSEALFVYTGGTPAVDVGDEVLVDGTVAEFRYKADHLSMTRIEGPTVVVSSTSNALPAAIVIGTGGRVPPQQVIDDDATGDVETSGTFDPTTDGIDFYESLEAMLVQVNDAVAVGGTSYGVIAVVGDNGDNAGLLTPRGGIVIQPDDFNPERILVDDAIVSSEPSVNVGASFTGPITGVIDYNDYDGNFNLLNVEPLPSTSGGVVSETTTAPATTQLRVASFNVYNLDPGDSAARFAGLAGQIVDNLQAPDIIGLQEIQDNSGSTDDGVVDATETYTTLIAAIQTAGGPAYDFRDISPEDKQDGGQPGGNIRVGFLFRTDRGLTFVDRPGAVATTTTTVTLGTTGVELSYSPGRIAPTDPAFDDSRKPLVGEFTFNGHKLFVAVNHFKSKSGDDSLFGHSQPPVLYTEVQRKQQAQVVNEFVDDILALDPNANVVVLGDLNDFQFSESISDVLAADILTNLANTLPITEQYTYLYVGNSQVLDHILVSDNLFDNAYVGYDIVHVNAEFAYSSQRPSDHDPVVATFTLPHRIYLPLVMRQY